MFISFVNRPGIKIKEHKTELIIPNIIKKAINRLKLSDAINNNGTELHIVVIEETSILLALFLILYNTELYVDSII